MSLFRRRFTPRGAPPGAMVPPHGSLPSRISVLSYDPRDMDERGCDSVADLPVLTDGPLVDWVDVQGLGDGTIVRELGALLDLHPLLLSDIVNVGQRPKVDEYEDVLFIVLRMVVLGADGVLTWEQVSLVMGPHYVLTFQETHVDCLEPLRDRIRAGRPRIRGGGADYLTCMVIDAVVDGYFPVVEHFGERLEEFERIVLEAQRTDVLADLYLARRELGSFRRSAWPLREALAHLMREESSLSERSGLHLRDTLDHVMQVVDVNESYRELAASLVDVHLSMVAQRTNDIMRVLTVVSAIFIPLTFVAGIYGMNFDTASPHNMPELRWPYGYAFFWGLCAVTAGTLLVLFRRLGWLSRPYTRP